MKTRTQSNWPVYVAALVACASLGVSSVRAEEHGHGHGHDHQQRNFSDHGHGGRTGGESGGHVGQIFDRHHHHDHFYPAPGWVVRDIGHEHHQITHRGVRYFYGGGVWYRHENMRFAVIAPPLGIVVPFLPPFTSTIWFGGAPYYYANNVYYAPCPQGYTVVPAPMTISELAPQPANTVGANSGMGDEVTELGPAGSAPTVVIAAKGPQLFIYPRLGQGADLQARDRAECNDWALSQQGVGGASDPDYVRALAACMDGRGYTVK